MKKILIGLIAASALVFNACGDGKTGVGPDDVNNPATANGDYDPESLPKIEFETKDFKFEPVQDGEHVKHVFKFKNTGKSNLIITSAKASCGCTIPEWPEDPIEPGGEGEIKVDFNTSGKSLGDAEVTKIVTVIANTQPPKTELKIHGVVKK